MQDDQFAQRVAQFAQENEVDSVQESIVELDLSEGVLNKSSISAETFESMLRALIVSAQSGNKCGFYVFEWFLRNHSRLSEHAKAKLLSHVAENFGVYTDPPLLLLMAEWLGSQPLEWAISTIGKLLRGSMTPDALRLMHAALDEVQSLNSQMDEQQAKEFIQLRHEYETRQKTAS